MGPKDPGTSCLSPFRSGNLSTSFYLFLFSRSSLRVKGEGRRSVCRDEGAGVGWTSVLSHEKVSFKGRNQFRPYSLRGCGPGSKDVSGGRRVEGGESSDRYGGGQAPRSWVPLELTPSSRARSLPPRRRAGGVDPTPFRSLVNKGESNRGTRVHPHQPGSSERSVGPGPTEDTMTAPYPFPRTGPEFARSLLGDGRRAE